ncbi:hypothetical protein NPIL_596051 [Nephila pilipes]|uniref:Uncharacterized protein n=1 Tax=Nephila pilipes TaxID=299642 RepID=A0A8X6UUN1_NEPPI|nr:hypothetical protein NPIL_596051 [Nephila pilipes]
MALERLSELINQESCGYREATAEMAWETLPRKLPYSSRRRSFDEVWKLSRLVGKCVSMTSRELLSRWERLIGQEVPITSSLEHCLSGFYEMTHSQSPSLSDFGGDWDCGG